MFACRCNPSALYSTDKLRETIGSSIRQAKHQITKLDSIEHKLSQLVADEQFEDEDNLMQCHSDLR